MKSSSVRILSLLLCVMVLLCAYPAVSVSAAEDEVVVLAGSDFQPNDLDRGKDQVSKFITNMRRNGVRSFDGLLFCGDYTVELAGKIEDSEDGQDALMQVLDSVVNGPKVFVQGNHDPAGCDFLSPSGANDADKYGVFVINEDDYLHGNSATARKEAAQRTAAALKTYLDDKVSSGYDKPVFVVSHVPLHFTARTIGSGDSSHANLLFAPLNEAGRKLNIFFLFGHNHNNGYDDYLGGAAIYLKKGDSINIAQSSHTEYVAETLNFTYMNAGYTGYYNNSNDAYGELTMTTFHIKGNAVTVTRWNSKSKAICNLKAAGVPSVNKGESGCAVNTVVYESSRLVTLTDDVPVKLAIPTTTKKTTTATAEATTSTATTTATAKNPGGNLLGLGSTLPQKTTTTVPVITTVATTTAAPPSDANPVLSTTVTTVTDAVGESTTDISTTVTDAQATLPADDPQTVPTTDAVTTTTAAVDAPAAGISPVWWIAIGVVAVGAIVVVLILLKKRNE